MTQLIPGPTFYRLQSHRPGIWVLYKLVMILASESKKQGHSLKLIKINNFREGSYNRCSQTSNLENSALGKCFQKA